MTSELEDITGRTDIFINRELSWLTFARRVLELTEDPATPLLERVKFAGIMGMIYDEFAMKRIGGLLRQLNNKKKKLSPDGLTPFEALKACRKELNYQHNLLANIINKSLRPALAKAGISIVDYSQLTKKQRTQMQSYFTDAVAPIITPLAVDAGHPFPFISTLSLNLALHVQDGKHEKPLFVRIKLPANRPRWVPLDDGGCVPLEQVISNNLHLLFPAAKKISCYLFRVIRGAKDDPWDRITQDETSAGLSPGSIIGMVTAELTNRKFAGVSRLEVSADMPDELIAWLTEQFKTNSKSIQKINGILAPDNLTKFSVHGHDDLRDKPIKQLSHPRLRPSLVKKPKDFFNQIKKGDILLHHPYHDFDTSTLRFLEFAARDPKVLAIKLTIYRTSSISPILQTLLEAIRRGKQVAVLVEITARFDEAPNIAWGELLEKEGAHVIYGMERLKTHVKLGMVVREEKNGIRRYVHIGTGNYHSGTAKLYEDLGLLSCDPELGESVTAVFNELTGTIPNHCLGNLLVAPHNLRQRFTEFIRREADHAREGRKSGITAKMNQLQDPKIIRELYKACQAGVPITLCIRGLCCLRAGVKGLSENIKVFSTLGRFLEHSRIYRFENNGNPDFLMGSADWMRRNLNKRMETVVIIKNPKIKKELENILSVYLQDNCTAWDMLPNGSYLRRKPAKGEFPRPAQEEFIKILSS